MRIIGGRLKGSILISKSKASVACNAFCTIVLNHFIDGFLQLLVLLFQFGYLVHEQDLVVPSMFVPRSGS